ncbi:replication-associated recombination protein A [Desulfofustis limnaeus]|jgi:putative ATPase|uniref:Replication-associated recombination protein A n=1 Tax=Desulfofustis limnaeus TaxID=2740163 RepID=A0ABN6M7H0_9BACT|nr:replication-associated recombination protein A [Desulfofustis limnaeus]MDX9894199.1 replication-associated recombination protein A [Desulfofustis sp.]BDD87284.1 ATPase AAA [Desulfofustis limnaeus]
MADSSPLFAKVPLAERMRPRTLDEFFGQEHLLGPGKVLQRLIGAGSIPSLILWGPPGSGKTTLAKIIARTVGGHFVYFSAVLSGVKEIRAIVGEAEARLQSESIKTILFVDEIHRFNKSQQDAFLPHVENGLLTLIGATTENPSFQVIAPLLSRCRVLVLESLTHADLEKIFSRALHDEEHGLGRYRLEIGAAAMELLTACANGDARRGLTILEVAAAIVVQKGGSADAPLCLAPEDIAEAAQQKTLRYDKDGEEHYNLISALHKSLRDSDPDGAIYWFYRMVEAGEDPLYISRRLVRFASEDVGLADPHGLVQANASRFAYQALGSPEGVLALAQTVVYLATAPKSNSVYKAANEVKAVIAKTGTLPVPMHLRNAPTSLMKNLGYGKGYQYAHEHEYGLIDQHHLPPELSDAQFYQPTNRGYEAMVRDRLEKWRAILKARKK